MDSGNFIESKLYYYKATVLRVIDGDTFVAEITILPDVLFKTHFRMLGINAPEMHGESAQAGLLSKKWLEDRIGNKDIIVRTYQTDSFGRWLAEVYLGGVNINDEMFSLGYAVPFRG